MRPPVALVDVPDEGCSQPGGLFCGRAVVCRVRQLVDSSFWRSALANALPRSSSNTQTLVVNVPHVPAINCRRGNVVYERGSYPSRLKR